MGVHVGSLNGPLNVVPLDASSWFCAGIPWRNQDGEIEVLVMKYRPHPMDPVRANEVQLKFIGGTNNDAPEDKTPEDTLEREILAEMGVPVVSYREPLHTVFKPARGDRDPHRQYFCLIEIPKNAEIRREPMWDGDELLEAPEWRVLDDALISEMFFTHKVPAERARISITRLAA